MWSILVVLLVGIAIGATANLSEKFKEMNSKLQHLGVIILLFAMGASLGLNKALLGNLQNIGLIAVVFAVLTSILSIAMVYGVSKFVMKGDRK